MEMGFCFALAWCGSISVGRILFPCMLEILPSRPRLLLLALALGMCVLGLLLWIRRSCFSFVLSLLFALLAVSLFPLFCPLVSVLLFACGYLSPLGLLA